MKENDYSIIYDKTIKSIKDNGREIIITFTDETNVTIGSYDGLWIEKESE